VDDPDRLPAADLSPGSVRRAGDWAVGNRGDDRWFAVSRRCRHQLADLSEGSVDADGCLVCPWHQSRYTRCWAMSRRVGPGGVRAGGTQRLHAAGERHVVAVSSGRTTM
jgi:hypothetical protein